MKLYGSLPGNVQTKSHVYEITASKSTRWTFLEPAKNDNGYEHEFPHTFPHRKYRISDMNPRINLSPQIAAVRPTPTIQIIMSGNESPTNIARLPARTTPNMNLKMTVMPVSIISAAPPSATERGEFALIENESAFATFRTSW